MITREVVPACPACGGAMALLFTSYFCPRDCDRNEAKPAAGVSLKFGPGSRLWTWGIGTPLGGIYTVRSGLSVFRTLDELKAHDQWCGLPHPFFEVAIDTLPGPVTLAEKYSYGARLTVPRGARVEVVKIFRP